MSDVYSRGEALAALNAALSEKEFQRAIMRLAQEDVGNFGWRVYHTRAVLTKRRENIGPITPVTSKGFPDLILAHEARLIYAEIKVESESKGRPTPDQVWWLNTLAHTGHEVYLWRPRHYLYIQDVITLNRVAAVGPDVGRWPWAA